MKRLKQGFTLSEILISLAVVGVVAAIAIPQISNQIEKEKTGPMLGKIVNQIEIGCKNMLQADYEEQLRLQQQDSDVLPIQSEVLSLMGRANKIGNTFTPLQTSFTPQNLASRVGANLDDGNYILQKYSASYSLSNINLAQHDANADIAEITIDTNGVNRPNSIGKDQFRFFIKNDCRLVPFGVGSENTCTGTQDACAARVVRDGFKIRY